MQYDGWPPDDFIHKIKELESEIVSLKWERKLLEGTITDLKFDKDSSQRTVSSTSKGAVVRRILLRISRYTIKLDNYLWAKLHGRTRGK